jgi:hypothetical protein
VQADGDVHGPSDDVSPTLKVTTRASPVNTVSEIAADRHGRSGELLIAYGRSWPIAASGVGHEMSAIGEN